MSSLDDARTNLFTWVVVGGPLKYASTLDTHAFLYYLPVVVDRTHAVLLAGLLACLLACSYCYARHQYP